MIASIGNSYVAGSFIYLKPEERKEKISDLLLLRTSLAKLKSRYPSYYIISECQRVEAEITRVLDEERNMMESYVKEYGK